MKFLFAFSFLLIATIVGAPLDKAKEQNRDAARAKELALSADKVVLRGELESADQGLVVTDKDWIRRFADFLGETSFGDDDHDFAIGMRTAYFYSKADLVLSITPMPGDIIRGHSKRGGGDYPVDHKHWQAIFDLMKERANQPPEPTR